MAAYSGVSCTGSGRVPQPVGPLPSASRAIFSISGFHDARGSASGGGTAWQARHCVAASALPFFTGSAAGGAECAAAARATPASAAAVGKRRNWVMDPVEGPRKPTV